MSRFTSSFPFTVEFEGDAVNFTLRRLRTKHAQRLAPFMGKTKSGKVTMTISEQFDMITVAEEILPDCVESMTGLKDRNGNALQFSDIVGQAYFISLHGQLLEALLTHSFLEDSDAKKSDAPSPAPVSAGPDTAS